MLYSHFAAPGLKVRVEESGSHGRLDMAVRTGGVYLFEFKVVERAGSRGGAGTAEGTRLCGQVPPHRGAGVPGRGGIQRAGAEPGAVRGRAGLTGEGGAVQRIDGRVPGTVLREEEWPRLRPVNVRAEGTGLAFPRAGQTDWQPNRAP